MCQVPEVQSVGTAIIMCFVITNFVIEHFAYISVGTAIIIMCIVIINSVIEHFARIRVHSPTSLCECRFESFLFVLAFSQYPGPYL